MKILVATDGTLASEAAIEKLRLMPLPRVSEIVVVTVVRDSGYWDGLPVVNTEVCSAVSDDGVWGEGWEHPELTHAEEVLRYTACRLRRKAGFVRTVLRIGSPAEEIVHVAQKMQVDLIVIGNKGRRGIDRWVLGSVSEKVLQRAKCPVLIVKPQKEDIL